MTDHDTSLPTDHLLHIDVESGRADHSVITLGGRLDAVEAVRLREVLAAAPVAQVDHLVIDLSEVAFVDSAGLAALARARRDRVLRGGTVTLVRPRSEEAMRVFRLTQFDEIFAMVDTRDESGSP
ncbi:hypothetical protein GCM10009867_30550 [Pedococcus aerophilus]|uniref:Anti-sigma factor antagonist n=1 Tax=Pedococcus aerophilus TaxID=436356 RepID=A0ABN3UYF9_9MICO